MTYRQLLWERLDYLVNKIDIEFAELITVVISFLGGLVLVLPGDTFTMSRTFTTMASLAPDWAWGALFVALSVIQAGALLANHYRARQILAMGMFLAWIIVDFTFWRSAWLSYGSASLGAVFVIAFWASAGWVYLRLGKQ